MWCVVEATRYCSFRTSYIVFRYESVNRWRLAYQDTDHWIVVWIISIVRGTFDDVKKIQYESIVHGHFE